MSQRLEFPPLLTGIAVPGAPLTAALASVDQEVEPGAVFYGSDPTRLQVALVLAPEEPLSGAIRVSFAATLGLNDALGALAPPEVAVHLVWPNGIKVNGADCGTVTAVASTSDPAAEPDWLILGLDVPIDQPGDGEPGHDPSRTTLYAEGCSEITAPDLTEAWARHMMNWLHIYMTEGFEPLHRAWLAVADGRGEGRFLGLDENGGLLVKDDDGTRLVPLTKLLAHA